MEKEISNPKGLACVCDASCEKLYFGVYVILIVFTVLTVTASQMKMGRFPIILTALSIASLKAVLIALYYMRLRYEKLLIYGIVLIGIVTAAILAVGIFPDIGIGL